MLETSKSAGAIDWLVLVRDRRWGSQQKVQLVKTFGSAAGALQATAGEVREAITGRPRGSDAQVSQSDIDIDLAWLNDPQNYVITLFDDQYPPLLKELVDPPLLLFATGDLTLLNQPKVAIVGSRRPTPVGAKIAGQLAADLSKQGITITSGMALGVDGIAHEATLNADGDTIAIMGCGLDIVYPARHQSMFQLIRQHGLLLSEYPLGYAPNKYTFPQRNRIVSGLSHGVIIIEAAERSGTLITARLAAEQNREVMVVPGSSCSAQYRGSHALIQQGAALITNADDALLCLASALQWNDVAIQNVVRDDRVLPADLASLLGHVGASSTSVDDIVLASGLTAAEVSSMLLVLELEGAITMETDGGYVNLC